MIWGAFYFYTFICLSVWAWFNVLKNAIRRKKQSHFSLIQVLFYCVTKKLQHILNSSFFFLPSMCLFLFCFFCCWGRCRSRSLCKIRTGLVINTEWINNRIVLRNMTENQEQTRLRFKVSRAGPPLHRVLKANFTVMYSLIFTNPVHTKIRNAPIQLFWVSNADAGLSVLWYLYHALHHIYRTLHLKRFSINDWKIKTKYSTKIFGLFSITWSWLNDTHWLHEYDHFPVLDQYCVFATNILYILYCFLDRCWYPVSVSVHCFYRLFRMFWMFCHMNTTCCSLW